MKLLLTACLFACAPVLPAAEKQPAAVPPNEERARAKMARAVLEDGKKTNGLHSGICIRIQAQLARSTPADPKVRAEAEARGIDFKKRLEETWEFTANQVHRVVAEETNRNGDTLVYRRAESRPFDTKNLCSELLDGKLLALGDD